MSNADNDNKFNEELEKELESGLHSTLDEGRSDNFTVKVRREEYIVKRRFYDKDKALETAETLRKDKRNLVEDNIHGGILSNDNEVDEKIDWDKLVDAGLEFDPPIAAAVERKPGDEPVGLTPIIERPLKEEVPDVEKTLVVRHKPVFPAIEPQESTMSMDYSDLIDEVRQVEHEISKTFGDDSGPTEDAEKPAVDSIEKKPGSRIYVLFACLLAVGLLCFYFYQKSMSTDNRTPVNKTAVTEPGKEKTKSVTKGEVSVPDTTEPASPPPKPAPFVFDKTVGKKAGPQPAVPSSDTRTPSPSVPVKSATAPAGTVSPLKTPAPMAASEKKPAAAPPAAVTAQPAKPPVKAPEAPKPETKAVSTVKPEAAPPAAKKPVVPATPQKVESVEIKDHFPFSVHVSSYKDPKRAETAVAQLKKEGFSAYAGLVRIPGKGDWYRVYSGNFKSADDAKTHSAAIKKMTREDTQIQKTAWAIQVGNPLLSRDAANLTSSLAKKGYMTYSVPVSAGSDTVRVLAGAFSSKTETSVMVDAMVKDGFDAKPVNR